MLGEASFRVLRTAPDEEPVVALGARAGGRGENLNTMTTALLRLEERVVSIPEHLILCGQIGGCESDTHRDKAIDMLHLNPCNSVDRCASEADPFGERVS